MSSNDLCKACTLLESLERGVAAIAVVSDWILLFVLGSDRLSKTDRARKKLDVEDETPVGNLRTIPYFQMPTPKRVS